MGKEIKEFLLSDGVATFKIYPEAVFAVKPVGADYFYVNYELLNPFEENEEMTDRIVGYSIDDINDIEVSEIPDIEEMYDIPQLGIKDMTIKEIVAAIKRELESPDQLKRKTA